MEKRKRENKKYSPEFKKSVILDMRENQLCYRETMRKYNITGKNSIALWERIYLEENIEYNYLVNNVAIIHAVYEDLLCMGYRDFGS